MATDITNACIEQWLTRRKTQGFKPGTVTHAKAQLEFFMGCCTAAKAAGVPFREGILLLLSVGRDAKEMIV